MPGGSGQEAGEVKAALKTVPDEADEVKANPAFQKFARAGIAARAVIYFILAYITGNIAATGEQKASTSSEGAMAEVQRQPGGRPLLVVLAFGLGAYATWRVAQALSRRSPRQGKAAGVQRAGWAAVAALYAFLFVRALVLAAASANSGGHGSSRPQPLVAHVLRWPAGPVVVAAVGAGLAGAGVALAIWGISHDYRSSIDVMRAGRQRFRAGRAFGVVGEVTRGLLVILVSTYVMAAALADNPDKVKTTGQALESLRRSAVGPWALAVATAGLAAFGVYSLFEAAYRDI